MAGPRAGNPFRQRGGPCGGRLLPIPAGAPVFAAERVTFLANGKPFEFVKSVMRGDRYSILLDLAADSGRQGVRYAAQVARGK